MIWIAIVGLVLYSLLVLLSAAWVILTGERTVYVTPSNALFTGIMHIAYIVVLLHFLGG